MMQPVALYTGNTTLLLTPNKQLKQGRNDVALCSRMCVCVYVKTYVFVCHTHMHVVIHEQHIMQHTNTHTSEENCRVKKLQLSLEHATDVKLEMNDL